MSTVRKILLVEDNETNLILFEDVLISKGYKVLIGKNGYEALEILDKCIPDLILMDIQLPELDGLNVIRTIRSTPQFAAVKIVCLSALTMDCDIQKAIEAGCDGYLTKPVSISTFLQEVEQWLKK